MDRLRALYIQPAASFGGAERQAAQNIRLLPRHGIDVLPVVGPGREIVEFLEDAARDSAAAQAGADEADPTARYLLCDALPDDPNGPRGPLARARMVSRYIAWYFRVADEVEAAARRHRSQLIFASRPFAWTIAARLGRRLGLPMVWRIGTHFEHWTHPPLLRFLLSRRRPEAVVYTSAAILRAVQPVLPAPSFVIHNGVDTQRFSPARRLPAARAALGLAPGVPIVGFVGRLAPEKGTELLLEVAARLRERVPRVQVLVAGDSGWRPALEARLAERRLGGTVRLLGFVRDIESVYAASDVVISTSEAEGCPNAVLEAMAMGRVVVATRVGGTAEILRDGTDGALVPAGAATELSAEVERLLAEPERRMALGQAAARHVAERFSLEAQVRRLAEVVWWAARREPPRHVEVQHVGVAQPARAALGGGVGVGAALASAVAVGAVGTPASDE